jgi:hypothetical protein
MWRVLSFKTIISQNLKDTPLSLSVHPQLSVIPPLNETISIINSSTIDPSLKNRISSAIGTWKQPSASTKIQNLVNSGLVTEDEFAAWKKARNPLAHADLPKCSDLQEYVDIGSKVLTLFYKLIFNCIAYNGPYVDYGAEGWPTSEFSAKV